MGRRTTFDRADIREAVVKEAVKRAILSESTPAAVFYDSAVITRLIRKLKQAFHQTNPQVKIFHRFAVKANPLANLLKVLRSHDIGAECASMGETCHALSVGFRPEDIVWDGFKKRADLKFALEHQIPFNMDCLEEVEVVKSLLPSCGNLDDLPLMGIRINPQCGIGKIALTSTSSKYSHFGVAFDPEFDRLMEAFCQNKWLRMVHVHFGSQHGSMDKSVQAVRCAVELAEKVNSRCGEQRIVAIDIGGGLPVDYQSDAEPSFEEYAKLLKSGVPELFSGKYTIFTEFGRALVAKSAFYVSRVEYTKPVADRFVAKLHHGANVFTRTAYLPNDWPMRKTVFSSGGERKTGPKHSYYIAGPLCFAGDLIARSEEFPEISSGDFVCVLDAGAYCTSNFAVINSTCPPSAYYVNTDAIDREISLSSAAENGAVQLTNGHNHTSQPVGEAGASLLHISEQSRGESVSDEEEAGATKVSSHKQFSNGMEERESQEFRNGDASRSLEFHLWYSQKSSDQLLRFFCH